MVNIACQTHHEKKREEGYGILPHSDLSEQNLLYL